MEQRELNGYRAECSKHLPAPQQAGRTYRDLLACRQSHGATGSASAHSPRRSACAYTSDSAYCCR